MVQRSSFLVLGGFAVFAVAAALSGCAGDGTGGTAAGLVTFNDLQEQVFVPNCALSGCHDAATQSGSLDMSSSEASHAGLVNALSECDGKLRVVPNDTANSYLLNKLGVGPEPCGSLMPELLPPLTAEQIDFITSWIEAGAPAGDVPVVTAAHLAQRTAPDSTDDVAGASED